MADKNLGAYKNMESAKDSMRPDFLKHQSASEELNRAETAATENLDTTSDNLSGALNRESSFKNSVTGLAAVTGKKGFFKSKGPIGAVISTILLVSGFMLGGQAMRPFALVGNLLQNFDTASFSSTARLKTIIRSALKSGNTKITPQIKTALNNSGLDTDVDDAGNIKSLSYTDNAGNKRTIGGSEVDEAFQSDQNFTSRVSKSGEYINNDSYYTSEPKVAAADRIDWQKNRYDEFDADNEPKTNLDTDRDEFEDIASGNKKSVSLTTEEDTYTTMAKKEIEVTDENGNTRTEIVDVEIEVEVITDDDGNKILRPLNPPEGIIEGSADMDQLKVESRPVTTTIDADSSEAEVESALGKQFGEVNGDGEVKMSQTGADLNSVKSKLEPVADAAGKASGVICLASNIATGVATVVMAQQIANMINIASGYLEAVQKVQAGDGNGSSLHWYENKTNETDENGNGFWNATSIASLFGSPGSTASKTSTGLANLENILTSGEVKSILLSIGLMGTSWRTCNVARLASNAISLGITVIGAITGPVGLGVAALVNIGKKLVIGAAVGAAMAILLPAIIKIAAKAFLTNVIKDMGTQAAGDYVVGGTEHILSKSAQSVGLAAGTSSKVEDFAHYQDTVLAERATYDRINLSPFDASSKYTFLGSILYSLTSFSILSTGNPFIKTLSATGSVLKSSLTSLLPTSNATTYSNVASSIANPEVCPLLNSVSASGTANHCMQYTISDTSTFDITYEEAKNYLCSNGQLENCSGTPTVVEKSYLEKYINYGTMRDVHLGISDSEAMSHMYETGNSIIDSAIGAIPAVGDFIDIVNAAANEANACYISGEQFVIGSGCWKNQQNGGETMNKYILTYLELDPLEKDLGLIEESTLANYLRDYYAKNPLDNSYEGKLARFSGMTKQEVIDTLAYMDYLEYIANYDPSDRYAFGETTEAKIHLDTDSHLRFNFETDANLETTISFNDLRTRNFAV